MQSQLLIPKTLSGEERQEAMVETHAAQVQDSEEENWIALARKGDTRAFDWLATRYRDRAVRLASHILRRSWEAEDVAQEAFLRAFTGIKDFRGECAFYSWLYKIVARTALNRTRMPEWKRYRAVSLDTDYPILPEASRDDADERMILEKLLDSLTPSLRAALVLREIEGLEYSEIADALRIPVGTVRSRISAAREQFRARWEEIQKESSNV